MLDTPRTPLRPTTGTGSGRPVAQPLAWRLPMPRYPTVPGRQGGVRRLTHWLLAALAAAPGCHHEKKEEVRSVSKPPTVQVVQPTVRNIVRVVGQPSFIVSYERTSIYPKLTGFIEKWNVDIGDKV